MMLNHESITRFAEYMRSHGKQPATIESYCRDAQGFLDYLQRMRLDLSQIEASTLLAYQDYLRSDLDERDNSVRRAVIGVRQFFRFLYETQLIKASPFDCVPIPERDETLPKNLVSELVDALIQAAANGRPTFKAARDTAIVAVLAFEGIKANELIALRWSDLLSDGVVTSLHIGGARARAIKLCANSVEFLNSYHQHYKRVENQTASMGNDIRMFIAFKGRDASYPLPKMTRHGLKFILYELGQRIGISGLNTEQLRHFAVTHLIQQGRAPDEIMNHLGLRRLGNIAKHLAASQSNQALILDLNTQPSDSTL